MNDKVIILNAPYDSNGTVMSAFIDALAIVIVLLVVAIITDAAIIYVTRRLAARNPNVVKLQRYEAGNPPVGEARYVFPVQYVGFLLMFLGIEPIMVILLVISSMTITVLTVIMIVIILLITLPSIYVGYKYALEMAYPKEFLRRTSRG